MVTLEHSKVKTTGEEIRNYISYFQSVTTIGIISRANNSREAELVSKRKLSRSDFMCGVVNQTPFELHATDEWKPEYLKDEVPKTVEEPTENYDQPIENDFLTESYNDFKGKLEKKLGRNVTEEDWKDFVKWAIEYGLTHA